MEYKTNPWTIILTALLTAAIIGGGVYYWQNQKTSEKITSQIDVADEQDEKITSPTPETKSADKEDDVPLKPQASNLKSYENKTLNISFSYPQDWGDVSQEKDGTDHISLSVFKSSIIFLAADNGGESVGRGAYWGDNAELIDSQSYINNLCDTKSEAQSCEIKTNSSGVKYAKVVEEVLKFGDPTIETNYYIYNPNSEFRGILLSTERLRSENINDLESKLQSLVDSFYFTD